MLYGRGSFVVFCCGYGVDLGVDVGGFNVFCFYVV